MTIIRIFNEFNKKIAFFFPHFKSNRIKNFSINPLIFVSLIVLFSIIFFTVNNYSEKSNLQNRENLENFSKSNDFNNLTNYFFSKINSPYTEQKYIIKNNDTIEKILKNFKVNQNDIKDISLKLKQKKLSNIYSGRELSLVLKKLENGSNSLVNLLVPINNTNSIEIRKSQNPKIRKSENLKI